jgi:TPR repeat protein
MYANGRGVEKDPEMAAVWYSIATRADDPDAKRAAEWRQKASSTSQQKRP